MSQLGWSFPNTVNLRFGMLEPWRVAKAMTSPSPLEQVLDKS